MLIFLIERLMGWHSTNKFEITTYEEKIDIEKSEATLNMRDQDYSFMIGFDSNLSPSTGRFEFNLMTFGADGKVADLETMESVKCDEEENPGVKYAQREL